MSMDDFYNEKKTIQQFSFAGDRGGGKEEEIGMHMAPGMAWEWASHAYLSGDWEGHMPSTPTQA